MKSMTTLKCNAANTPAGEVKMYFGDITETQGEMYLIDTNTIARRADGIGMELIVGDRVAYMSAGDEAYIVSLLTAQPREELTIKFPCSNGVKLVAESLELLASRSIGLRSGTDINIDTGQTLRLQCRHLLQTAVGNLVSVVGAWIQKSEQASIETEGVMRSHAGSHIVTAQEDLRLDAKRINMG